MRQVSFLIGLTGAALLLRPAQAETQDDLVAKAKAEKEVVYYTELIIEQIVRPLAGAFEKKYGIKVTYWRGDSQAAALKLALEHKSGRAVADVWSTASGITSLIQNGLIDRFATPSGAALPAQLRDPNGYWVATNTIVIGAAANTDQVPAGKQPHSYDDLLAPQWRGQIAWKPNDVTGAWGFIGSAIADMGEEGARVYLKRLSAQNIAPVGASTRAILDGVVGGEHAMVLGVSAHNTEISRKVGAPIVFLPLSSAWATLHAIGVTAGAPHPNAARLFVDFAVSPEGQALFRQAGYLPARPDVPPLSPAISPELAGFKANLLTPEVVDRDLAHWSELYTAIFR